MRYIDPKITQNSEFLGFEILSIFMIFKVSAGTVGFVTAETNGGGPLGHPRVLRVRFPREWKSKVDIFEEILQKSEVTTNGQPLATASGKEGQIRSKSHYENFAI